VGWRRRPTRILVFAGDLPLRDDPLPRFLDDAAAAKLLQTARNDPDPFVRLAVEFLARTGLRKGELLDLTVNAVVQIGSAYWLHVPVGKLRSDRYIPLHPQLKELLDTWLAARPATLRSKYLFIERGRRIARHRVDEVSPRTTR
jgi:integrase